MINIEKQGINIYLIPSLKEYINWRFINSEVRVQIKAQIIPSSQFNQIKNPSLQDKNLKLVTLI